MNPVVHFEMPAADRKRMIAFYTSAFGWKMQEMGADMGGYVLAGTTATDANGRPTAPGTINGGFFPRREEEGFRAPLLTIAVDDIRAHVDIVKKAGGTVHGEPVQIPGVGWYVPFTDTEGNRASMLQPQGM